MQFKFEFRSFAKLQGKRVVVCIAVFVMLFSLMFVAYPGIAVAKAEYANPATELVIKLNDGSGNVTTLATYTVEQLKQMPQAERAYSSVDSMPAPNFTAARGVLLKDLLAKVNIDINTVEKFYFTATDDYRTSLTIQYLFDTPRYYFPKIYECWDENNTLESITYKPGVEEGKTPVEPVVAIESHQARAFGALETTDRPRFDLMDGKTTFRLFFGQADAGELINSKFVRWMNGIEIVRLPSAVSAAPVSSSVMLTAPAAGQTYRPGDKVTISGMAHYLIVVTVNVTAPDGQTVHTARDLDAKTGSFSTEFTLGAGAADGDYSIKISGTGLAGEHTATFQVVKASSSVALTAPAAGQAYRPGDKVTISGTAQNLAAVTVNVTAPGGQTVHTASDLGAKSGNFSTEFTLGAGAADGDYSIKISGAGLAGDHMATFKVSRLGGIVMLTTLTAGRVYQPGDKVTIGGTAQNLAAVTVNVTGPGGQTIHAAIDLDAKSGSFSTEFTLGAVAAAGDYSIKISGAGLAHDYIMPFKVAGSVPAQGFLDLDRHWAQKEINELAAKGVLKGVTETEFMPDACITRAQFAAMLVRALNIDPRQEVAHTFQDVPAGAWHHDIVGAAVNAGLVSGYSSDVFGPDESITREQMTAMIARAMLMKQKLDKPDQEAAAAILQKFKDENAISAWAKAEVALAVKQGIIQGKQSDGFLPQEVATRAEAAVMISRFAASLQ